MPWYQRLANGVKDALGVNQSLDSDIQTQIDKAGSKEARKKLINELVSNGTISASDAADYANLFGISY